MTSVALLRGINLGKKNKVDMISLRSLFEQMTYKNVRTYIQTGNVLLMGHPMTFNTSKQTYGLHTGLIFLLLYERCRSYWRFSDTLFFQRNKYTLCF